MRDKLFVADLLKFIEQSPTPFHAVSVLSDLLESEGFVRVNESDAWALAPEQRFIVTRSDGSLIAIDPGSRHFAPEETGFHIVGAHTDSPGLKLKPEPLVNRHGFIAADVEVYGGLLMNTWFDRDLSLAGRISGESKEGHLASCLIDFKGPVAVIPSAAIHLNREANKNKSVNPQKELIPLLMAAPLKGEPPLSLSDILLGQINKEHPGEPIHKILGHDLFFYDVQKPSQCGLKGRMITGARLDNLLSCFAGADALMKSKCRRPAVLVLNNHEEIGSASSSGAEGDFLKSVLLRLCGGDNTCYARAISKSVFVSTDNAHGIHPNYPEFHDTNHRPMLNHGPVIKINASQRYATDSDTAAHIHLVASRHAIPLQTFVMRSDMACGSTIGPITSTTLGVKTVDIGVPTFAMHSVRETAGVNDGPYLRDLLAAFWAAEA